MKNCSTSIQLFRSRGLSRSRGFTLVELLATLTVLVILD